MLRRLRANDNQHVILGDQLSVDFDCRVRFGLIILNDQRDLELFTADIQATGLVDVVQPHLSGILAALADLGNVTGKGNVQPNLDLLWCRGSTTDEAGSSKGQNQKQQNELFVHDDLSLCHHRQWALRGQTDTDYCVGILTSFLIVTKLQTLAGYYRR